MLKFLRIEWPIQAVLSTLLPLPWCWVIPGLLGLLGSAAAGLAIAPELRALTWPLLVLTILLLGWGWRREIAHRGGWRSPWAKRARLTLVASTLLAASLWGLRFAGLLGIRPL